MQKAWEEYGCNEYDLVVLAVAPVDNNSSMKKHDAQYGFEYPTATGEGNGNSALAVFGYPVMPSIFLVKPDKSYAKVGNSSVFTALGNAGVSPHECDPTEIGPYLEKNDVNNTATLVKTGTVTSRSLSLLVCRECNYTISLFSMQGQELCIIQRFLTKGCHVIPIGTTRLADGVYLVKISNDTYTTTTTVLVGKR